MKKLTINNQPVTVVELLKDFEIITKDSSNVDYYGTDGTNVFIQFKNGSSYLYSNVTPADIEAMKQAESIGRFIPVLKKYPTTKYENRLVVVVQEEALKG
jgi:hypothetical protein